MVTMTSLLAVPTMTSLLAVPTIVAGLPAQVFLAAVAGPAHLLERVGRRQVDDVERRARDLGERRGAVG